MRSSFPDLVERGRVKDGLYESKSGEPFGAFMLVGPCGCELHVIATDGLGLDEVWEHVSVSTERRTPNWKEMCWIKSLFWEDEECVVQFHPPKSQYINCHPFTLHLWRRPGHDMPLPPSIAV